MNTFNNRLNTLADRCNKSYFQISGDDDRSLLNDTIMCVNIGELSKWYQSLNQTQRKNFFFVAGKVCDYDTFLDIVRILVIDNKIAEITEAAQEDAAMIYKQEQENNRHLTEQLAKLRESIAYMQNRIADMQEAARKILFA